MSRGFFSCRFRPEKRISKDVEDAAKNMEVQSVGTCYISLIIFLMTFKTFCTSNRLFLMRLSLCYFCGCYSWVLNFTFLDLQF